MVEVTQADVAAAKKYGYSVWRDMKTHELIEGQTILECLASHRESTEQSTVDRIVAWLRNLPAQQRVALNNESKHVLWSAIFADAIQNGDWK